MRNIKRVKIMITEDYCSSEIAKLLEEKGFNEYCFALYDSNKKLIQSGIRLNNIQVGRVEGSYSAPTLQMAMKWLRCRGIYIEIDILGKTNIKYGFTILKLNEGEIYSDDKIYTTFEEAVEAALRHCLTELI